MHNTKGESGYKNRDKNMKKKVVLLLSALILSAAFLDAAVTIRIQALML